MREPVCLIAHEDDAPPWVIRGASGRSYELRDVLNGSLAKGGMGSVSFAHLPDGRPVAVKRLHGNNAAMMWRFTREAELLARITYHPHIVKYIDVEVEEDGRVRSLLMEWLSGDPLSKRMCVPIPLPEALSIAEQIADAVAHMHGQGITHRDLKPGNLTLEEGQRVKIFDLGVAADQRFCISEHEEGEDGENYTRGKTIMGSFGYMPPEGADLDAETTPREPSIDVYSLGAILFEMLAGPETRWRNFSANDSDYKKIITVTADKGLTPDRIAMIRQEVKDHPFWSGGLRSLLDRMTRPCPEERPSMSEVRVMLAGFCFLLSSTLVLNSESLSSASGEIPQPDASDMDPLHSLSEASVVIPQHQSRWPQKRIFDLINIALGIVLLLLNSIIFWRR